ncbi:TesB-like acyl-CoA thioesterase 3 [Streptomyces tateyamensis]|uniref:TesB-like acyl-CoA thioesterase 3 n=1 Tax=Streptomyces tateyamensis TaxID=565073 RepID=A0A2V4N4M7_9ACTN|nr:thioesterase family protein [Streptomyces tateyamensis]PYC76298.1 TesB-like acyl-CoA thioesterase 3 [Streptomyces tateyamensis]
MTPASSSEFDQGIALRPDGEAGWYRGELGEGWQIGGGINGGFLLAAAANALRQELPQHPDPLSISGYYLSASTPGPYTVRTEVVRKGNSLSNATAVLYQQDEHGQQVERLRVLASYTDLAALDAEVGTAAEPPAMPPREQCIGAEHAPPQFVEQAALLRRFDLRLDPACVGWALGQPSGNGRIQGWFRLADDREPDPLALLLVADALPPVTFDLGRPGWAPTIELTVHLRALPAAGWLRVSHATRNLAGGYFEEDCEIWDEAGRLVAQSRQLARTPRAK